MESLNDSIGRVLETLRASNDNESRKGAAAELRQIQEAHPDAFLEYTFGLVASTHISPEVRFYAATNVLAFVESSWHNAVSKELQQQCLHRYLELALAEPLPSQLLARKVATIIAVMARRGAGKAAGPGQLPPLMNAVATAYTGCLEQRCLWNGTLNPQGEAFLPQLLVLLHIFLKEAQMKRVGSAFEVLCQGMVAPLSAVFGALAPYSPLEKYDAYLFLFKAALRVFGSGVFEASFYHFLLDATWKLADGLSPAEDSSLHEKRARLIDYGVKILERVVNYFPTKLHALGTDFFLPGTASAVRSAGTSGRSLFSLLDAIIATAVPGAKDEESLVMEKTVCRAMRLLTFFASGEDGDAFMGSCLAQLGAQDDALLPRLLRNTVVGFLPDHTDAEAEREWHQNPEKVAGDLDIDFDDDSPMSCAEQLFIALTGSTAAGAAALSAAWALVNELLSGGNDAEVTAALHAIGIGYNTMACGDDSQSSYAAFLQGKLLPILAASAASSAAGHSEGPSLLVLRRVVWLVGMWCESVPEPALRHQVHAALETLMQSYSTNVVILLTTLRAIENFYTDSNFTLAELSAQSAPVVLTAVQHVLSNLKAPTTVRQVACLVSSMVNKGAVDGQGDGLLAVFAPATVAFIAKCEQELSGGSQGAADWGDEDEGDTGTNVGVLPQLLETLTGVVKVSARDTTVWQLFGPVVRACTEPGRTITPWAEDAAWELLLTMARTTSLQRESAVAGAVAAQETWVIVMDALRWCRANSERDFETLHIAVRSAAALLLLAQEAAPSVPLLTTEDIALYVRMMLETRVEELSTACLSLLLAAAVVAPETRMDMMEQCASAIQNVTDIQGEAFGLPASALLALTIRSDATGTILRAFVSKLLSDPSTTGALLENLVLVLDVCGNRLTQRCICWLLQQAVTAAGSHVAPDVTSMVSMAVESAFAEPTVSSSATDDADGEENRPQEELLLEMLGDEDVTGQEPHMQRLLQAYGPLTQWS